MAVDWNDFGAQPQVDSGVLFRDWATETVSPDWMLDEEWTPLTCKWTWTIFLVLQLH